VPHPLAAKVVTPLGAVFHLAAFEMLHRENSLSSGLCALAWSAPGHSVVRPFWSPAARYVLK